MRSKLEEYRAKGYDAEMLATLAHDPDVRRHFEDIARQWFELAELLAHKK
jgi:hypothetical protein